MTLLYQAMTKLLAIKFAPDFPVRFPGNSNMRVIRFKIVLVHNILIGVNILKLRSNVIINFNPLRQLHFVRPNLHPLSLGCDS